MGGYILSPEAEDDVFEIWRYLAKEIGTLFADQVEAVLFDEFGAIAETPGVGVGESGVLRGEEGQWRLSPFTI